MSSTIVLKSLFNFFALCLGLVYLRKYLNIKVYDGLSFFQFFFGYYNFRNFSPKKIKALTPIPSNNNDIHKIHKNKVTYLFSVEINTNIRLKMHSFICRVIYSKIEKPLGEDCRGRLGN